MTEIETLKRKLQEAKDETGAWRQRAEQAEAELDVLKEELAEARAQLNPGASGPGAF